MDNLKLFAKSYDQIDSLVNTVYIFCQDIQIESRIKNLLWYLNEERLIKLKAEV